VHSAIRESLPFARGNSIGCAAPETAMQSVKHRVCRVCDPRSKLSTAPLRDLVDVELIDQGGDPDTTVNWTPAG
jgi:hypothetical protein